MPGPDPTDRSVRQRTNKKSTRAVLYAVDPDEPLEIPDMPKNYRYVLDNEGNSVLREVPFEFQTVLTWEAWWRSPMRQEWTEADYYGLCRLIILEDRFWKGSDCHSEIRLAQKDYGLTPLDRRRLEWTIEQTDKAQSEGEKRRRKQAMENTPKAAPPPDEDPRQNLA